MRIPKTFLFLCSSICRKYEGVAAEENRVWNLDLLLLVSAAVPPLLLLLSLLSEVRRCGNAWGFPGSTAPCQRLQPTQFFIVSARLSSSEYSANRRRYAFNCLHLLDMHCLRWNQTSIGHHTTSCWSLLKKAFTPMGPVLQQSEITWMRLCMWDRGSESLNAFLTNASSESLPSSTHQLKDTTRSF